MVEPALKKRSRSEHDLNKNTHFEENFADPDVDNLRIAKIRALIYPQLLLERLPCGLVALECVTNSRQAVSNVLNGDDRRLLVVVGPCSIHDTEAAIEYAHRLLFEAKKHASSLLILMRVYFEKPRTTVGWKGLINDPMLDGSFEINKGLETARKLLLDINSLDLPVGCEFLDSMIPQYIADLVSWGAIGARTTESQLHRELASGLSMPVGFKNATSGDIQVAVDACRCAVSAHSFLGITKQGLAAIVHSRGNADAHIILRGGDAGANYEKQHIERAATLLEKAGLRDRIIVDCSHGNSLKNHKRQHIVVNDVASQMNNGEKRIVGVMIESHLFEGNQSLPSPSSSDQSNGVSAGAHSINSTAEPDLPSLLKTLKYGVSITDKCIGWEETVQVLQTLAEASKARMDLHPP